MSITQMSRPERFVVSKDSQFIQKLEVFIRMTITHIFTKYKESPLETKNANIALSQFIQVIIHSYNVDNEFD